MHETGKTVVEQPMSLSAEIMHMVMILCSGGLWLPVYLAAKRRHRTVVRQYQA
jgi:hypothetical protein